MALQVCLFHLQERTDDNWLRKFKDQIKINYKWNQQYYFWVWNRKNNEVILFNFMLNRQLFSTIIELIEPYWTYINLLYINGSTKSTKIIIHFNYKDYPFQAICLKKKTIFFIEEYSQNILRIINANNEILWNFCLEIKNLEIMSLFNSTEYVYPYNQEFQNEVNHVQIMTDEFLSQHLFEEKIGDSLIKYNDIDTKQNAGIYSLLGLYNNVCNMNHQSYVHQNYQKYNTWVNHQISSVFTHISRIFTAVIRNLFIEKIHEFNDLSELLSYDIKRLIKTALAENNILIDKYALKGLITDINVNIKMWIKICRFKINKKKSTEEKGKQIIKILQSRIPDYMCNNKEKWDYKRLGALLL